MSTLKDYGFGARFEAQASMYPDLEPARVIAQHKGLYKIADADGERLASVTGKLRHEASEIALLPAVGDYVMISRAGDERAVINAVLPRRSVFLRTAVGITGQAQIVAANIDVVFICMSLNNNFNLSRLERYLAVALDSGAKPVILLTKSDLCGDLDSRLAEVERVSAYCDVVVTSVYEDDACERVLEYVKSGVTASFIGSSGVGKSTLINKLMGRETLATAETGRLDKGRHTTTGREMLILPNGGIVIDTPGMRELGVESADTAAAFADIEELERLCRFADCTHTGEPDCAVQRAVEDGTLDKRRLDNYFKIKREAKYDGLSSRQLEETKLNDMLKDVGGMKNMRKYIRENDKRNRGT